MSDNRPARYVEDDGTVVYRASGLAMCDRIYVALEQGYDPMAFPAWFQAVLDEGTEMEDVIRQRWVAESTATVEGDQTLIELEIMDGVIIRGHIDGIARGPEGQYLWEAKKIRPSGWGDFKRKGVEWHKNYPMQFSTYMIGLGKELHLDGSPVPGYFVGGLYDPDAEEIIDLYTHAYYDPPVNLMGIRKRIAKLESIINAGTHAMDVSCPPHPDFPCPFFYLHDDDAPEPSERPPDDTIAPILDELPGLEATKRDLDRESRKLGERIKVLKGGIEGWYETSGLEHGEETTVEHDGGTYTLKVQDVARAGYVVEPGGYTKVTVKPPEGRTGKTATTVKKTAAKKTATKKAATKKRASKKTAVKKTAAKRKES